MRAALIINPAAGRGAAGALAAAIREELRRHGISTELAWSEAPGDVAARMGTALAARPEAVIVAGGDGTVHEAVNGWMQAGGGAPLGIIPVGTGNDFMKMFGADSDWRAACARLANGSPRQVDIGCCHYTGSMRGTVRSPRAGDSRGGEFYFANGLGIGFDAQVAREAERITWLRSDLVYGLALCKVLLWDYRQPRVRLQHAAGVFEEAITLIAVQNGRVEGGRFVLAPDARLDDGELDVVLAGGMSRGGLIALVPQVVRGRHLGHPKLHAFRTHELLIESDVELPVHADGETRYSGARRLAVRILPRALRVIV